MADTRTRELARRARDGLIRGARRALAPASLAAVVVALGKCSGCSGKADTFYRAPDASVDAGVDAPSDADAD